MPQFNGLKTKVYSQLLQAGGVLFLASIFSNFCNLLFWLFMVRKLNTIEYGVLNTLFSIFMILSLPANTIQTVITKFVAQLYAKLEFAQIKCFMMHFGKRIFLFGILFLMFFIILSPTIGSFLKIPSISLIIITGLILFISIISPLTMGILQGAQMFLAMSVNGIASAILKLILGIILVAIGFKVMGVLVGFGLSVALALCLSFFQIPQEILVAKKDSPRQLKMNLTYQYFKPVSLSLLAWMILTNGDVILVKHFFSPMQAGFYSIAQMIGKIILFLPGVIVIILFPKMSEASSQGRSAFPLLKKGLAITAFLCVGATIFCSLLPDLVLKIITQKEAQEAARLVPPFCIAMTLYALVNQFVFYNLAIQKFRFAAYLLLAVLLQFSIMVLFHPNLSAIIFSLILTSFILFCLGFLEAKEV